MAFRIKGKVDGLKDVMAKLATLQKQTTRSKILRKAVNAAARPMLQEARARVPVDSGWLKKSLGLRIQTYRSSGTVVAVIGPRTGFQKGKKGQGRKQTAFGRKLASKTTQRPTYYAHLVEFGTKAHSVASKASAVLRQKRAAGKLNPGAKPKPFLRPAFAAQKEAAQETMRRLILEGVYAELK